MHSKTNAPRLSFNQYYFLLLPLELSLKGYSHTNHKRIYNYKLSLKKEQKQFDSTKTPVSIIGGLMNSTLSFNRSHILSVYIPVFNPHRKVEFTLNLNADYDKQDQYVQVASYPISSNRYIESYNESGKKWFQLNLQFGEQWVLKSQLYINHTRNACQAQIRQRYPELFSTVKNKLQEKSKQNRKKSYSVIGVSFNRSYTPNKFFTKQQRFLNQLQNRQNDKDQLLSVNSNVYNAQYKSTKNETASNTQSHIQEQLKLSKLKQNNNHHQNKEDITSKVQQNIKEKIDQKLIRKIQNLSNKTQKQNQDEKFNNIDNQIHNYEQQAQLQKTSKHQKIWEEGIIKPPSSNQFDVKITHESKKIKESNFCLLKLYIVLFLALFILFFPRIQQKILSSTQKSTNNKLFIFQKTKKPFTK